MRGASVEIFEPGLLARSSAASLTRVFVFCDCLVVEYPVHGAFARLAKTRFYKLLSPFALDSMLTCGVRLVYTVRHRC